MADRYWVGGTASWDGTAGTKWSATNGGPGGANVPTTADDVFFTNLSTGTVTIAGGNTGAKSINCTGFSGTITGITSISVAGSVTLSATMTYTHSATVTITGTGTLTTAGKAFSTLTINGAGITVTLGDALSNSGRTVTLTAGTFDTAGFTLTTGSFLASNSNVRSLILGASTWTISGGFDASNAANFTVSAGTSQINLTLSNSQFNAGVTVLTFNNVSFTSVATGTRTMIGSPTFNNLTLNGAATGLSQLSIPSNITVTGTLTCSGTSSIQRCVLRSANIGSAVTITVATLAASDCDFRDITIAGAAAGSSPTRAGNCGGNSGITFPAAKTVYRVGTNNTWAGSASWATGSNGTGNNANFPLAQDTAVIDNGTAFSGTLIQSTAYSMPALDCSNRSTGFTLSHDATVDRYGSYVLGSGITVSGNSPQTFAGRSTMNFNSAGKTITYPITINSIGGSLVLQSAVSTSVAITHNNGTLDLNGFTFTGSSTFTTGVGTKNLTFNGGTLLLSATGTPFNNAQPTGFTTTKGTGDGKISLTSASAKTFAGGGSTFNCIVSNDGAGALTITGSNAFDTLANGIQPTTFTFTAATTTTINNWNVNGTAGNLVTIGSATAASHTLSKSSGIVSANFLSISRSIATGGAIWYAGASSTDGGNNTGWIFADAPGGVSTSNFLMMFI